MLSLVDHPMMSAVGQLKQTVNLKYIEICYTISFLSVKSDEEASSLLPFVNFSFLLLVHICDTHIFTKHRFAVLCSVV